MRDRITTALELAGIACIASGLFLVAAPAGLIGLGVGLLAIGYAEAAK